MTTDPIREEVILQLKMLELIARMSRWDQTNEESIDLAADGIMAAINR